MVRGNPRAAARLLLAMACTALQFVGRAGTNSVSSENDSGHDRRRVTRRLESVALPAGSPDHETGWILGRASFFGPPESFTNLFTSEVK